MESKDYLEIVREKVNEFRNEFEAEEISKEDFKDVIELASRMRFNREFTVIYLDLRDKTIKGIRNGEICYTITFNDFEDMANRIEGYLDGSDLLNVTDKKYEDMYFLDGYAKERVKATDCLQKILSQVNEFYRENGLEGGDAIRSVHSLQYQPNLAYSVTEEGYDIQVDLAVKELAIKGYVRDELVYWIKFENLEDMAEGIGEYLNFDRLIADTEEAFKNKLREKEGYKADIDFMIHHCYEMIFKKQKEYATEDDFHNFNVAARLQNITPKQALIGMMDKHVVSVHDLVNESAEGREVSQDTWIEKIGDNINYLLLLYAMVMRGEKDA